MIPILHTDMPMAAYLADPAPEPSMTASIGRNILATSPARVWLGTKRLNPDARTDMKDLDNAARDRLALGSVCHHMFTGAPEPIAVIDADAWRTKAAKDALADALDAGKIPIKAEAAEKASAMARAARAQAADMLGDLSPCLAEPVIMWPEGGAWNRCRPDLWDRRQNLVIHYKTTSTDLNPRSIDRFAIGQGWDLTAAHYGAGIKALTGEEPRQVFFIQETAEPFLCMAVELGPIMTACGASLRVRALDLWARCVARDRWPGLPRRILRVDAPPWYETQIEDAERAFEKAAQGTGELDLHWQAPAGFLAAAAKRRAE